MAVTNLKYDGTGATETLTITLASLGIGAFRESTVVDNTAAGTLFTDCLLGVQVHTAAAQGGGTINLYVYGSFDGTEYPQGLTGADAVWTPPHNSGVVSGSSVILIDAVTVGAGDDDESFELGAFSIAPAFGGIIPPKWGIIVHNDTDTALHATAGNFYAKYRGVEYESA